MPTTLERPTVTRPHDRAGRPLLRAALADAVVTRSEETGDPIGFKGKAIVFNSPTWIGSRSWGFWEQIAPGSVTKTIDEHDIRFLQNHDPNMLLARNKAGTLRLNATDDALEVDADMAPTSYARDLALLLERGDISQMSFAFEIISETRSIADDDNDMWTVNEMKLYDVSVVTYPAYEDTEAGLRSEAFAQLCRSAGIPAPEARRMARQLAEGGPIPEDLHDLLPAPASTTRDTESQPPSALATTTQTDALVARMLRQRANQLQGALQ